MTVYGLDLSLTRTGIAGPEGTSVLRSPHRGVQRLDDLRLKVLRALKGADLVAVEGYSFGSHDSHAHELGELGGVVRLTLWLAGIPYAEVPPASLKRYACGKGNASKGMVLEAAVRRSGLDFGGDNNRADAAWLRWMAMDHLGEPVVSVPAAHREALAKVPWPEVAA